MSVIFRNTVTKSFRTLQKVPSLSTHQVPRLSHRRSSCSRARIFDTCAGLRPFSTQNTRQNFSATMEGSKASHAQTLDELASTLKDLGINEVPQSPNTYPQRNPIDIYRAHIADLLASICEADRAVILQSLQWTTTLDKGDLILAAPALRLKGKKPDQLAKELAEKFPESPLVEKPVVAGTFVQFFFKSQPLAKLVLPSILKSGTSYGYNSSFGLKDAQDPSKGRKKMIVEFSSPNIAKPFHAGHLRSTIIGGFLANLYEAAGWDVTRINYLGDWGKQYGVLAVGFDKFGSEEALKENPIGHLYDVYVKISAIAREEDEKIKEKREQVLAGSATEEDVQKLVDESVDEQARKYFKRMCDGDKEALGVWKRFRDLSIEKYKETYGRLNIRYDDYSGESQVKDESMEEAAKIMAEKGVSQKSDGAVLVDLTKHSKKLGKVLVQKKDGTSLYITRDIGTISERVEKYNFDKMIYVVAMQQDLHFAQLFKIVELTGRKDISDKCQHINFGMVLGMSTRKGTAKFLNDILRDVGDKMHEVMRKNQAKYEQVEDPDKTADTLGISAVMVQDMRGKRINNYEFDMDRMTSFEGDTGPYLQYAHARLTSIFRKLDVALPSSAHPDAPDQPAIPPSFLAADLTQLSETHAAQLVRMLAQWPDVYINALKTLEPTTVLTYLFKMVHVISSSYDHLQILGSEEKLRDARCALYCAARVVLGNGMRLLGLTPVDRM